MPVAHANLYKLIRCGGIGEVGQFVDASECTNNPHGDIFSKEITHRYPLREIEEAFQVNLRPEGLKVIVEAK